MIKNIHREIVLESSPEEVWEALTNPKELSAWLMETHDFFPEKGKKFIMQAKPMMGWDGKIYGEIILADKPRILSYTWKGDQMNSTTVLKWTLTPTGVGTILKMDHSGFEGFSDYILGAFHSMGWKKFLRQLDSLLKKA